LENWWTWQGSNLRPHPCHARSAEGIFICDLQEQILLVNKAFERLTGTSAAEALGKTPRILRSGRQECAEL
jgi:PAS domain S-box-containing protein